MASDFCCGAECGITTNGTSPTTAISHWDSVPGATAPTIAVGAGRNGGRAYRFAPTVSNSYFQRTVSDTVRWGRLYFKIETMPGTNARLLRFGTTTGTFPEITIRPATSDIVAIMNTSVGTPFSVTTGQWYRLEWEVDVSTGIRSIKMSIALDDNAATDLGTTSASIAASTITQERIGVENGSTTCSILMDDIIVGSGTAQYPIGPGTIVGLLPARDNTHSISAAGDFKYDNSSNVLIGATDTYTHINHRLGAITSSFLAIGTADASDHLSWGFDTMPAADDIHALEFVSGHHSSGTSANKETGVLIDGSDNVHVFEDVDFSNTTLMYHSKHYTTRPGGGALTDAAITGYEFQWNSSLTLADASDVPFIDGIVIEVDYIPSTAVTRFYTNIDASGQISPAIDSTWEFTVGGALGPYQLNTDRSGSSQTGAGSTLSTSTADSVFKQFISEPLDVDQTIDGDIRGVFRVQEASASEDAYLAATWRVVRPDGTERGVLLRVQDTTTTPEMPTAFATRSFSGLAVTPVSALAGDRIVFEVGAHGETPAGAGSVLVGVGVNPALSDFTLVDDDTSTGVPWFEIGQVITFSPAGSAYGSGAPVATLSPFTTSATATQTFNASGAAVATLSAFADGVANSTGNVTGSGAAVATLSATATGAATMTPDAVEPPPPPPTVGGRIRFQFVDDEEKPKRKKKRKKPPTPEADPLAEIEFRLPSMDVLLPDPQMWQQMLRTVPLREQLPPQVAPQAPLDPSNQLQQGTIEDRLLHHFLQMVGAQPLPELNHDDIPFHLARFLRMGR